MSEWYYSKDNLQQGPVSSEQLRQLAAIGQLQPSDLVWKEEMSQWTEARRIKGLFPMQTAANPSLPPPVPADASFSPSPIAVPIVRSAPPAATPSNSPALGEAPALWNPKWLGAWSLFLSWGFGAFLLAKNWKALGEPGKAKRAMVWFYALFPWMLLCLLTANIPLVQKGFEFGAIAILVAFMSLEVRPQLKFVKERFNDQFIRKSWWKPAGITIGCFVAVVVIATIVAVGLVPDEEHPNVAFVKTGHLTAYPNVPVGKAVDGFLASPRWEAVQGKDGKEYVNLRGGAQFQNKPIRVTLQFRVDRKARSFEVNALEFNDLPQNDLMKVALLSKMFEGAAPTANTTAVRHAPADSGYAQITTGMAKAQVESILGAGQELSNSEILGTEIVTVQYETDTYRMVITYNDGQVFSKQRVPK